MENPQTMCQKCGEWPATVRVESQLGDSVFESNLCAACSREGLGGFVLDNGPDGEQIGMEQLMGLIFSSGDARNQGNEGDEDDELGEPDESDEFGGDDDPFGHDDPFGEDEFGPAGKPGESVWGEEKLDDIVRCAGCGTTWDTIRTDGRVGCAACYATFATRLAGVMEGVQRGPQHLGKTPRAAGKRRMRLEHLRKRRDHQLAVLQNRLHDAVRLERFEDAAKLRDKIKVVAATVWNE